jgi:indole-3-glycerol phosphate synthase
LPDFLDVLAKDALRTIQEGFYEPATKTKNPHLSLREAILQCKNAAIISEIKFRSPSAGVLKEKSNLRQIAKEMEEGGAIGISILTEPKHFKGCINYIAEVREHVKIPILMKDIILSPIQIKVAQKTGANAILLIMTLFERGYCEKDVQGMIEDSHSKGLEVLLEVHTRKEFLSAVNTNTDMIGINNRDLKTLKVNLELTKYVLTEHKAEGKVIVSESGINSSKDIRLLRRFGAQAFLVGTTIIRAENIKNKVRELVDSL